MSYKSSEGSTYASRSITQAPLFGAVGSFETLYFGVPATASEGEVLVYQQVLPKGTWMYTASSVPLATSPNELTGARLDVGTGYPTTSYSIITTSGYSGNTTISRQVISTGVYYSDGVTPLQAVLTCTTSAGTWSVTNYQSDSMVIVTKIA